jgi:hypothetical protein
MTILPAVPVTSRQGTPEVRMFTTIAWIAGPTVIFVGWFLMSMIAGSQKPGGATDNTSLGLVFLFALITSIPLIIVSLVGGVTTLLSDSLRTLSVMNVIALIWNAIIFVIYFGLFGIIGSLPKDGFPVTSLTIAALIPISLVTLVLPVALFFVNRRAIRKAMAAEAARVPADAFDI